jgi:hypothetical protein
MNLKSSFEAFRSEINQAPSASLVASANPTLVASANPTLVGIPVFSGSPSAPELNLASGTPSSRASLDLEGGGVSPQNITNPSNQSNVNASLVFSGQINH